MDRWDRLRVSNDTQRPVLLENETEILLVPKVAIYDGETPLPEYQQGSLTITNHRILWRDATRPWENSISLSISLIDRFGSKVFLFMNQTRLNYSPDS